MRKGIISAPWCMACVLVPIILLFSQTGFTQETKVEFTERHYLQTGIGLSVLKAKDANLSPLTFSGSGPALQLGFLKSNRLFEKANIYFSYTPLGHPTAVSTTVESFAFDMGYTRLYPVLILSPGLQVKAGGRASLWGNGRLNSLYSNNLLSYELALSAEAAARLSYDLTIGDKDVQLAWDLSLPLLSYIIRPAEGLPYPIEYLEDGEFNLEDDGLPGATLFSGKIGSLHNLRAISADISFTYFLQNSNALTLGYSWNYYDARVYNRAQVASHTLILSLLFNL
ncbi:MAG: hypothetical protein WBB45_04355 [Cyclobacteriaceae bacterium]